VPNPGQEVAPRDAVAPRAVGDEAPRLEPQPSQQPLEKALCRRAISPVLHQEVQHRPVLIDRAPKVAHDAVDADEDLILSAKSPACPTAHIAAGNRVGVIT
jgi:hypothetical protein